MKAAVEPKSPRLAATKSPSAITSHHHRHNNKINESKLHDQRNINNDKPTIPEFRSQTPTTTTTINKTTSDNNNPIEHSFLTTTPLSMQIIVNNTTYDGILDTGSNLSLMSTRLLQGMDVGELAKTHIDLDGIGASKTEGSCIYHFFIETKENDLLQAKAEFHHLPSLKPMFILGTDFINSHEVTIHSATNNACINGHNFKIRSKKQPTATYVVASTKITIPAKTSLWIPIAKPKARGTSMMEAMLIAHGPSGQAGQATNSRIHDRTKHILFSNWSKRKIKIRKGQQLGKIDNNANVGTLAECNLAWTSTSEDATTGKTFAATTSGSTDIGDKSTSDKEPTSDGEAFLPFLAPSAFETPDRLALDETVEIDNIHYGKRHNLEDPPKELIEILTKHREAFTFDGKPGQIKDKVFELNTEDAKIGSQPLRPLGPGKREEEKAQLKQLLEWGIVEPSNSRASFPIVMVNQNGKTRYCVDYRQLNEVTVADTYPMQRTDAIFQSLGGGNMRFSGLDAARGYHQFKVKKEDRWKTAFITHQGLFQYKRLPFGLKNAPAFFQRFMDELLGSMRWSNALVYINDVIIYTKTLSEHVLALDQLLTTAIKCGLKFSAPKSFFGCRTLKLLGRLISPDGFAVIEEKARGITRMADPKTLGELQTMLGLFGYYRNFIPNYAQITSCLTKANQGYKWKNGSLINVDSGKKIGEASKVKLNLDNDQLKALEELRLRLSTAPVLAYPDYTRPFILYTDASHKGMGFVLSQKKDIPPTNSTGNGSTNLAEGNTFHERMEQEQRNDKLLRSETGTTPTETIGMLWKENEDGSRRIFLPEASIQDALNDMHDAVGHLGISRTLKNLSDIFYRPHLNEIVEDYVDKCNTCQTSKKTAGSFKKFVPSTAARYDPSAFGAISLDPMLGLPKSGTQAYDCILVVTCLFTRAVILIATHAKGLTAAKTARLFHDHVCRRGFYPRIMISDSGQPWISAFWRNLNSILGTKLIYSPPHHQQANPVERYIQTIQSSLRAYTSKEPKSWVKYLTSVEIGINSTVNTVTGYRPFDLLYVRHASYQRALLDTERSREFGAEEAEKLVQQML